MSKSSYASQHETHSTGASGYTQTFISDQQVNIIQHTVISTKAKLLSYVDSQYIDCMTAESILGYIRHERLTNMPQPGSRWDKVLKWAQFFSSQISRYEEAISSFVPDSKGAAQLIWVSCQTLLEVGISIVFVFNTFAEHLRLRIKSMRLIQGIYDPSRIVLYAVFYFQFRFPTS
jgi:hypothetical protein